MEDMKETSQTEGYAKALYSRLERDRQVFLDRARDCSKFTIPTLVPPAGASSSTKYYTPYQAVGARGVNNLASKLLLTLFPPNTPCFRLQIDDYTLEALTQQEGMRAKVEEGLNKRERATQNEIEAGAIRVSGFEALKHLLVSGNVLLFLPEDGSMRVFRLDRYVVRRDPMGNVLDIVIKEDVSPTILPQEVKDAIGHREDVKKDNEKSLELYTHVYREGKQWKVYQEVKGIKVPDSDGTYPLDKTPYIPVRFIKVDGENYGRSYVEEYFGDLVSLEGLSQAIVEGSAAASKVLFLVNPNGTTRSDTLAEAANGAIIDGLEQDVSTLQMQKFNDFRVALETMAKIEERLAYAFLLNSAIQRSGERVTAEEVRYMANELESALGGIYSILSQELQLPVINRIMHVMEKKKKLPPLPKGTVTPVVVTGMEALGRGNDLTKLEQFIQPILQVPELASRINMSDYLTRRGTALGIDMKGLVKSEEQVMEEQQQAMQQQMLQQGLGPMIQAGGRLMEKGMDNGESTPSPAA